MMSVRDFQIRDFTSNLGVDFLKYYYFSSNPQGPSIFCVANLCWNFGGSQPKSYNHPGSDRLSFQHTVCRQMPEKTFHLLPLPSRLHAAKCNPNKLNNSSILCLLADFSGKTKTEVIRLQSSS